jgi:hypothetical protein
MDVQEVRWEGLVGIFLVQDRHQWWLLVNAGNFSTNSGSMGFSRRILLH